MFIYLSNEDITLRINSNVGRSFIFSFHVTFLLMFCCMMAGNKVKLQTFKSWNFAEIGYKVIEESDVSYVNFVWCKLCAKNKESKKNTGCVHTKIDVFMQIKVCNKTALWRYACDRTLCMPKPDS